MKKFTRRQFLSQLAEMDQQATDRQEPIMWMNLAGRDKGHALVLVPGWPEAIQVDEEDLVTLDAKGHIHLEQRTSRGGIIRVTAKGSSGETLPA